MPSSERGLYEPTDDVRVFDAAEDEEEEEGSRLPLLIVLALLVLGAFGGVVWLAYKQGQASGRGEPLVITSDAGPAKVAPSETQTGQTPNQGLKIYEQPAPADENLDPAQPMVTEASAPAAAAPMQIETVPAATVEKPPAAVVTPPPKAAVTPPPKPVVTAAAAPKSTVTAAPKPVATALPPPTKPVTAPATAASAPPKSLAPPAASSGSYMLQVGSFKSEADANAAWRAYQAKHSTLLAGYGPDIKQADLGDKGTWYRLRLGGFADKDVANALCDRLKANGGSCILAAR